MKDKKEALKESTNDTTLHAILYTDGGCKPSRGFGGWGVHGYVFNENKPTQGSGVKGGQPTAKGYNPDRKTTPVTVVQYIDGWGSFKEECTNNSAEITALLKSLEFLLSYDQPISTVRFLIDSKYVINGASKWITQWSESNWIKPDGERVSNADLWMQVQEKLAQVKAKGITLHFGWVKGHSGDIGNSIADRYAGWGITKSLNAEDISKFEVSEARGYWSPKNNINRMFCYNHWYFNTKTEYKGAPVSADGRYVYHQGNQGKDDDLGYSASTAVYSVIMTKEEEPVLETIRVLQDKADKSRIGRVAVGRLDNILKPGIYKQLRTGDPDYLHVPRRTTSIHSISGEVLTQIQEPARLAFRAVEALSFLEDLLERFLRKETQGFTLTDITERIYYHDEKDKKKPWKIRKDIDSRIFSILTNVNYDTGKHQGFKLVPLILGSDIARRNTLSALAERSPKVYAIAWREADNAFRYGTIIEAGEDVGIWACVYSNLKLVGQKT